MSGKKWESYSSFEKALFVGLPLGILVIAALFGTFAYFPTLVEVPVANLFLEMGMHQGPLMSYLLVDPGVSLQTLLVINTIIKPKKTMVYAFYMLAIGILMGYLYGLFM